MMTFKQFAGKLESITAGTSRYPADPGEVRGRQEPYTRKAPLSKALFTDRCAQGKMEGGMIEKEPLIPKHGK
jgi:hypothetical protein